MKCDCGFKGICHSCRLMMALGVKPPNVEEWRWQKSQERRAKAQAQKGA